MLVGYITGLIGMWLLSDGIYSWVLYANAKGWNGVNQTFLKDHWIRLIRILCGIALIVIGAI